MRLHAVGAALVDPAIGEAGDVDTAAVILTTASGRICQISNSRRAAYGYDQRVEVHGAKGMLRAENQLESTVELATEAGFRRDPAQHFFLERYEAAYLAEMRAFVAAVTSGSQADPGIEDGLQAQILADAATLSRETGQPWTCPRPETGRAVTERVPRVGHQPVCERSRGYRDEFTVCQEMDRNATRGWAGSLRVLGLPGEEQRPGEETADPGKKDRPRRGCRNATPPPPRRREAPPRWRGARLV